MRAKRKNTEKKNSEEANKKRRQRLIALELASAGIHRRSHESYQRWSQSA